MRTEFRDWWDEDDLTTQGNPFSDGTPAYWAWEGWCAGVKAEREVCVELCYQLVDNSRETRFATAIRARSNT